MFKTDIHMFITEPNNRKNFHAEFRIYKQVDRCSMRKSK